MTHSSALSTDGETQRRRTFRQEQANHIAAGRTRNATQPPAIRYRQTHLTTTNQVWSGHARRAAAEAITSRIRQWAQACPTDEPPTPAEDSEPDDDDDDDLGEPFTEAEWAEVARIAKAKTVELVEVKSNIPGARLPDYSPANDPRWRVQKKRDGGCAYGPKKGWWLIFFEDREGHGGVKTLERAAEYIAEVNAIEAVENARTKAPQG